MKIGVTYENGQIFQHFGHTEQFRVYEVQDGKVVSSTVVDTNGSGHGALAGFLKEQQVDTLICGGIGAGAQNALAAAGIRLYGGIRDSQCAVQPSWRASRRKLRKPWMRGAYLRVTVEKRQNDREKGILQCPFYGDQMKKELDYFQVEHLYGGCQDWFTVPMMKMGGCAAIAACESCIYFDLHYGTKLYPFEKNRLGRKDYIDRMKGCLSENRLFGLK